MEIAPPSPKEVNALDALIAPEVLHDEFYRAITELARSARIDHVLEIGSSSGGGSTQAWVEGLRRNPRQPKLYCMEVSRTRCAALQARWAGEGFVHCLLASSVRAVQKGFNLNRSTGGNPLEDAEAEPTSASAEDGPTVAIRSNLKQISFAAQSWFLDHPDVTEVPYPQLIEAELLFPLEAVQGESYQDLKVQKNGGTLTVKDADGTEISRDYEPATE